MARDSCLARITVGVAVGGAVGGAVGAVYGTYEAVRYKIVMHQFIKSPFKTRIILPTSTSLLFHHCTNYQVPGLLKIRHIGQTTLGSAALFGLFLGAGSLIHCGKSY